jgi:hypothetical protein
MSDKLGESSWTSFTKKQGLKLDDVALVKALGKFDKTDGSKPAPRVDALEEVIEQARRQIVALAKRKKELGDKPFKEAKDKLDELLGLAESEVKLARTAAADSEEEADSPVLLTTKMIPLVRELRKGEARMPALISTAGKETAVLIMRRSIASTRRKLMMEYLDAQGGAKHIAGECRFEQGALTFIVGSPAAGLAKRVRAALLKQLELRLKVRVRGEDGGADEDGEDGGEDQQGTQAQTPQAPVQPASEAALEYTQRLGKLRDRLEQALRAKHPESTKLRAVMGFASEKAAGGDHVAAIKALQMLEKLLDGPATTAADKAAAAQAEYARRQRALQERVQLALQDQHPASVKLRAVMGFAADKATSGDYGAALKAFQVLEGLLETPAAEQVAAQAQIMQARLQAVREDAAGLGAAAALSDALREAAAAVQANAPDADTLLDALEQRLAALAGERRAAGAAETVAASRTEGGVGVVEFAKMRLELEAARGKFEVAIDSLKSAFEALLETEDFVDDPRSSEPETLARIDTLEQRLPSFPELAERVDDAIDNMANATDPKQRKQHGDAALKAIAAYRARIDAEPMLTEMESTDAGSFPIHSAMVEALERIESALRA